MEGANTSSTWTSIDDTLARVEDQDFKPGRYTRGFTLGTGSFGRVLKVKRLSDGKIFAGKAPRDDDRSIRALKYERTVMNRLRHAHILGCIDWFEEDRVSGPANPLATLLVTELCIGTLQTHINNVSIGLPAVDVLLATSQIASALSFIHSKGMLHGDMKPSNVLVRATEPLYVLVSDLGGMLGTRDAQRGRARGTTLYWSPEQARTKKHGAEASDVWGLGRIALSMAGLEPGRPTIKDVLQFPLKVAKHATALKELNPDNSVAHLLTRLLEEHEAKRATAGEAKTMADETLRQLRGTVLPEGHWSSRPQMGIQMPEGFRPVRFW